jgi:plasmid maintenance system killer protein
MILSCRDKRTGDFAAGKRVKQFSGFAHAARLKMDRLEAATSLQEISALPGHRFEALNGVALDRRVTHLLVLCFRPDRDPSEKLSSAFLANSAYKAKRFNGLREILSWHSGEVKLVE